MSHRIRETIRTLAPGSFAFVMATGIISTALQAVGWVTASLILLWIAAIALVVLTAMLVARLVLFPRAVAADARHPARAFGYFTVVAGINVLAVRVYDPAHPTLAIVLAAISVPVWLVLTYGVPAALMLRRTEAPVASEINGGWFLWVVGTQSLATAGAAIARGVHDQALAAVSIGLWGIGVMLYIILSTLVMLRLLTVRSEPASLGPSYWIFMGATAITVLAGSRILLLPPELPIMAASSQVVSGLTFVLWAFGVWWVPLLIVFGAWRHLVHRVPLRYEPELWSIVFPLGMYSVASMHFGAEMHLQLVVTLGQAGTWVACAAWLIVVLALIARSAPIVGRRA